MMDYRAGFALVLVLVRMVSFLAASPLFSLRNIPQRVKIGICLGLTALVTPQVNLTDFSLPQGYVELISMVLTETITGLTAGIGASMVFSVFRMAGQYLDLHIGFAAAQLFDPMSVEHNTLLAQFLYMLGIVLLFSLDAHHFLLMALAKSFQVIPLGRLISPEVTVLRLMQIFGLSVTYALRIAFPVIVVLFLFDLGLGFISRAVPQFNVLMAGFPLKIFVGVLGVSLALPVLGSVVGAVFEIMEKEVSILFGF